MISIVTVDVSDVVCDRLAVGVRRDLHPLTDWLTGKGSLPETRNNDDVSVAIAFAEVDRRPEDVDAACRPTILGRTLSCQYDVPAAALLLQRLMSTWQIERRFSSLLPPFSFISLLPAVVHLMKKAVQARSEMSRLLPVSAYSLCAWLPGSGRHGAERQTLSGEATDRRGIVLATGVDNALGGACPAVADRLCRSNVRVAQTPRASSHHTSQAQQQRQRPHYERPSTSDDASRSLPTRRLGYVFFSAVTSTLLLQFTASGQGRRATWGMLWFACDMSVRPSVRSSVFEFRCSMHPKAQSRRPATWFISASPLCCRHCVPKEREETPSTTRRILAL